MHRISTQVVEYSWREMVMYPQAR